MLNHSVEIIETYRVKGVEGVNDYVEYCTAIAQRAQIQKEAIEAVRKQQEEEKAVENNEEIITK